MSSIPRLILPTYSSASSPAVPRSMLCASCSPGTGRQRVRLRSPPPHDDATAPATPLGRAGDESRAAGRMAIHAGASATGERHLDAGWLSDRDRHRTVLDPAG